MASTWVVGDIHGCARELDALLARLALGADDELVSVGDLFHRGPDPVGVFEILRALPRFRMVLGNHERALLRRAEIPAELAPDERWLGDRRAAIAPSFAARGPEILDWLRGTPNFLRGEGAVGDRGWIVVHGSLIPGTPPEDTPAAVLTGWQRLAPGDDAPAWVHGWRGPELAVFGHRRSASGPHHDASGALSAYGVDTGCVYGGALTALRLEDAAVLSVTAQQR